MRLGFGQIETALREMHWVDPSKERGFRARLRYLQQRVDIGIPRAGGGRRANYTVGHALLFGVALELEQFGMTPERVAMAFDAFGLEAKKWTLREAVSEAVERLGSDRPAVLIWFIPEALSDARAPEDDSNLSASTMTWSELDGLPADLFAASGRLRRLAIVNLSALIASLIEQLGGEPDEIQKALIAWANDEEAD